MFSFAIVLKVQKKLPKKVNEGHAKLQYYDSDLLTHVEVHCQQIPINFK